MLSVFLFLQADVTEQGQMGVCLVETWRESFWVVVISALGARNFEKISGSLQCPRLLDIIDLSNPLALENLWFRVYYGNSGYLPSIFQRRDPDWDKDLATHLSRSFVER